MTDPVRKPVATILVALLACAPVAQGYQYVRSNPINRTDPSGLASFRLGPMWDVWGKYFPSARDLAEVGGYTLGVLWAGKYGGFGPRSMKEKAAFIWENAGFVHSKNAGSMVKFLGEGFAESTLELLHNTDLSVFGPRAKRFVDGFRTFARGVNGISFATPIIAAASAYIGILDSVMWTTENDH